MTPYPLAGLQAMSGTWDSIDARFDEQIRSVVCSVIERNKDGDALAAANRADERRAGLDSSPRGAP